MELLEGYYREVEKIGLEIFNLIFRCHFGMSIKLCGQEIDHYFIHTTNQELYISINHKIYEFISRFRPVVLQTEWWYEPSDNYFSTISTTNLDQCVVWMSMYLLYDIY